MSISLTWKKENSLRNLCFIQFNRFLMVSDGVGLRQRTNGNLKFIAALTGGNDIEMPRERYYYVNEYHRNAHKLLFKEQQGLKVYVGLSRFSVVSKMLLNQPQHFSPTHKSSEKTFPCYFHFFFYASLCGENLFKTNIDLPL